MTPGRGDGGKARTRREVLRASAGLAALTAAGSAHAQEDWWKQILGDPTRRPARQPVANRETASRAQDDLRPGSIPWRSDEMLQAMDDAIARYERFADRSKNWPEVPNGRLVRLGEYDKRIPLVRQRLVISGELTPRAARAYGNSFEYDRALDVAVRRFQGNHGLRVTGFINRSTRAQLNISANERLRQLRLNRERIARLVNGRIEDRYVLVNVPAYQLEAVERFEVQQRHRVIVGKADRQTPDIQATIKGLNFFPYWRVPISIAKRDLVPRVLKEPDYLEKEHIRPLLGSFNGPPIDPQTLDWNNIDHEKVRFRQDPGEWNALGLVRVNMPNKDIVYLHDTPMKDLFKSRMRAFSAGCVRVQDVMDLVAWIVRYQPGFEDAEPVVQSILNTGEPVDVELNQPLPVYFTYITAWAEPDGRVVFRPDIYGRDGSDALRGERDPDDPAPPVTLSP